MEETKFVALIRSLEDFAAEKPGAYRIRVALLAALGYLYLLVLVTVLLAIAVALVLAVRVNFWVIKIAWIPLVIVGMVLRSLWVTPEVPDGAELEREQAPALFDLVHEVTAALQGPQVHHIILSGDFNAGIVQIPQFGMVGGLTNYLVVGLPLLRALNPAQFRAVLAHEVGHLSAKHSGGFTAWIYRVRTTWARILINVRMERRYGSVLFEPFLNWYAPYLQAYSFVLARAQERHADTYAVELTGRETVAVMLSRLAIKDSSLSDDFWRSFFLQSRDEAKAPSDPFARMLVHLNQPVGPVNAQRWFYRALEVPTGYEDTHPALSDRLAALGFPKDSPETRALLDRLIDSDNEDESAAAHYLRDLPADFLDRQNRLWREQLVQTWNENHAQANEAKRKLAKLEEQANERALTIEEQWERATFVSQLREHADALPLFEAILREDPAHAGANFATGAILLKQHNPEGVAYLEKAVELNPETTGAASMQISGFYFEQGNKELAESFRKRADEHFKKEQRQQELAFTFTANDKFIPHELSEATINEIRNQLSRVPGLLDAVLVRKVVEGMDPFYVLAVHVGLTWRNGVHGQHTQAVFAELSQLAALPEPMIFLSLDGDHSYLRPKLERISGAVIYKRPQ